MAIAGTNISISNPKLPFFLIIFVGIVAFGSVLYWREKTISAAEYVDFPIKTKLMSADGGDKLKSKNFQIEVKDTSPSVN